MAAPRGATPRALIIIPTHDHASTLPWSIRSVQEQTVVDWELVVIGDGVGDDTRAAVAPFVEADPRIRFIDREKGERLGERYRDEVIRESRAPVIGYLCDDDLLMPWHLETMIEALGDADFANPLPTFIHSDDSILVVPTDLADPASRAWHFTPGARRNSVSLTGVVHSRSAYERLPFGWRPAPRERWSDHFMWEQFLVQDDVQPRAVTVPVSTTAKFHAAPRYEWTAERRARELERYFEATTGRDFRELWDARVAEAILHAARVHHVLHSAAVDERDEALRARRALEGTLSWRLGRPLRAVRALLRREYR